MQKPDLKKFPLSPGVYLFKNYKNRVIYVGRATYLRKRIANYFSKHTDPKTSQMVSEAKKLDYIKTDNLFDAVILEANLIKEYQPKFNIREKDNRSFNYIIIPKKEWSYPFTVRGQQLEKYQPQKAYVFGPFKSYSITKNILLISRKLFPYSTCRLNQEKPCFHNQIGLCPGKCTGAISQKDYQKNINNLILLLSGKKKKITSILKKTSPEKLQILRHIDDSVFLTKENNISPGLGRIEGYDISHFAGKETVGSMVAWQDNGLDKTQYRLFKIRSARPNDDLAAMKEMLSRRLKHKEWTYPNLILVDGGKTQIRIAEKVLNEYKLSIPVAGIAKYEGDRLIFGKIKKPLKELISLSFPNLLKIRDEAHRFANSLRKKLLKKQYK
jgi:excinuclease ABC subunit C